MQRFFFFINHDRFFQICFWISSARVWICNNRCRIAAKGMRNPGSLTRTYVRIYHWKVQAISVGMSNRIWMSNGMSGGSLDILATSEVKVKGRGITPTGWYRRARQVMKLLNLHRGLYILILHFRDIRPCKCLWSYRERSMTKKSMKRIN